MNKFFLLLTLCLIFSCKDGQLPSTSNKKAVDNDKINGVSFVAPSNPMGIEAYNSVIELNANWACLMPYGYSEKGERNLHFNIPWQWWGEKAEGLVKCVEMAKQRGLKVMVKPHVWIVGGGYTGHFNLPKESDWENWEKGYEKYILNFAAISDSLGVEIFCIGTELENFVEKRPKFWSQLIDKVKAVFHGKITYAANWDEYKKFPYWNKLDFIGVDAYFPLSDSKTPTVNELTQGWETHVQELIKMHQKFKRPVLFTEMGYRNVDHCASSPWESGTKTGVNHEAQVNAYQALFNVFRDKDWFMGGFIWKWFDNHKNAGGESDNNFTPQNKPVEELIKKEFSGR